MTMHWLGVGLSSVLGLRRLVAAGYLVRVWNRTVDKAAYMLGEDTQSPPSRPSISMNCVRH
ncbi:MAG: hypothetical protein HRT36_02745 [Alphaproteobacteria bacterium]|nr:hypothetical protein [Alphaproteobacteria bacterium]